MNGLEDLEDKKNIINSQMKKNIYMLLMLWLMEVKNILERDRLIISIKKIKNLMLSMNKKKNKLFLNLISILRLKMVRQFIEFYSRQK